MERKEGFTNRYDRREFLRQAALGASALGLAGMAGPLVRVVRAQARPIPIALVTALTGPSANWGQRTAQGFQVAVDLVNQAGGIRSKGGAPLELRLYDTQSRPEVAGQQTEKAIADGAVVIAGTNQSAATLVATQITERRQVPFVTPSDIDPLITGRGFRYTFRTSPIVRNYAYDLINFYKQVGERTGIMPRSVAILCENSVVGSSAAQFFEEAARAAGFQVFAVHTYDATASNINFTPYISQYRAAGVDILVGHNKPADCVLIVRTAKELQYNPMAIGFAVGGAVEVSFVEALGADSDYITGTDGFSVHVNVPAVREANEIYRARYGVTIDSNSAQGFTACAVIAEALENARSLNPRDIRDAMAQVDMNTGDRYLLHLTGVKFDEKGDNAKAQSVVWQLKDGVWHPIAPEQYATRPVVWPKPPWNA